MAFIAIRGRYRPEVGVPDGDSVRFAADDTTLWQRLEGKPVRLSTSGPTQGTVQLRFEGIDSVEKDAIADLAGQSVASMKRLIGHDAATPEPAGWILARMTDDAAGRPISWLFTGGDEPEDGSEIFLDAELAGRSVNVAQMRAGLAYPLYYNTLFRVLRETLAEAQVEAEAEALGYWATDATEAGVTVRDPGDLATIPPIWPKLWRRLQEYLRGEPDLSGFRDFLEEKNERIDIISLVEERGLQDVVEVDGDRVRMLVPPEDIRVVGDAGLRRR